jgi:hypothetical protein
MSGVLILSLLLPFLFFSSPKKAEAQWVTWDIPGSFTSVFQGGQFSKEYILDFIANNVVKAIIKKITAQTVNWINSGFKGNPAYITNPDQFFLNIGDDAAAKFITDGPLQNLCSPFRSQIRLALVQNYLQETGGNYSCTLGDIENNFDDFTSDFNKGGWDSWFAVTQNRQNNPYGAYLDMKNELALKIGTQKNKYEKQLDWGKGFLSYEKCPEGKELDPSAGTGDCMVEKETVTPGSVINDQLSNALGSPWRQLEAADEINEIVSALMIQLVSYLMGEAESGLRGLSSSDPSSGTSRTFLQQIVDSADPNSQENQASYSNAYSNVPSDMGGTGAPLPSTQPSGGNNMKCTKDSSGNLNCTGSGGNMTITGGSGFFGGSSKCETCAQKRQTDYYLNDVRSAAREYLTAHPEISDRSSADDLDAVAQLRDGVIEILKTRNFYARTTPDSSGVPYPQMVVIRKEGDPDDTTYRVTAGGGTIVQAVEVAYCGGHETIAGVDIVPTFCASASSIEVNPIDQTVKPPVITSISLLAYGGGQDAQANAANPLTVYSGQSTLYINGTNLAPTVEFSGTIGGTQVVTGKVNSAKTQVVVKVPGALAWGNGQVIIYKDPGMTSNAFKIKVRESPPFEAGGPTPIDATSGWRGGVAYNSTNNTWLVVSQDVNGRIIDNNGVQITPQFKINDFQSTSGLSPKVAYAQNLNKYLVIWDSVGTTHARFVNPDGSLGSVSSSPQGSAAIFLPNSILRYDSKNKKFVFVWEGRTPAINVYLQTIDAVTGVFGPIIKVTTDDTLRNWAPALAVNDSTNSINVSGAYNTEYCVIYDTRNQGGVALRTVNGATGAVGPETFITEAAGAGDVSLSYDSNHNKYLATWMEGFVIGTRAKLLNSCDGTDGGKIFTVKTSLGAAISAYNPRSDQYGIVGVNWRDAANGFIIINSNGTIIKTGDLFTAEKSNTFGNFAPVIAPNINDGTFGVISSENYVLTRFIPNVSQFTITPSKMVMMLQ